MLEHISNNLDGDLSVEALSCVASFSKFHFHRLFTQYTGLSVHKYVQLERLKRASYQLSFRDQYSVIDVALNAGFATAESFSRAFRHTFAQSPRQFKQNPCWSSWRNQLDALNKARNTIMSNDNHQYIVKIVHIKAIAVAVLEHHGSPATIFNSVKTFIKWRKTNKLPPSVSRTFNIFYQDPTAIEPQNHQIDLCAATHLPIASNEQGVVAKTLPSGRYAVLRHVGSDNGLTQCFDFLYSLWLEQSNEQLRDFPAFIERVAFYPEVRESEMITDIYLPLQ